MLVSEGLLVRGSEIAISLVEMGRGRRMRRESRVRG